MPKQNILPNPSLKQFEVYMDFSGGLNSETGNEKLRDNEFPVLVNVDLAARGSAKRRTGRTLIASIAGTGQGLFYYKRDSQTSPDLIAAVSGQLWYLPNGNSAPTKSWSTGLQFSVNDQVANGNNLYKCITAGNAGQSVPTGTGASINATAPTWTASTSYSVGAQVVPGSANGYIYTCTVAGTSGNSAPTWPTTSGATITDGTVTWTAAPAAIWSYVNALFTQIPITDVSNPAWVATTQYAVNQYVQNGTNVYKCTQAGTSASGTGPAGIGTAIVDGTVTWSFAWPITAMTFQTAKLIQGIQYKNVLYIATGTKLVEFGFDSSPAWRTNTFYKVGQTVNVGNHIYKCTVAGTSGATGPTGTSLTSTVTDGGVTWQYIWDVWFAAVVNPYTPNSMEAIYIGLNGLASNPSNYLTGTQGPVLQVLGIQPTQNFGIVNQAGNLTAIIEQPTAVTSVTYAWSYRLSGTTAWTAGLTANDAAGKVFPFTPTQASPYDIQLTITDHTSGVSNPATSTYTLSNFPVYPTVSSAPNMTIDVSGIQTCRCIMVHWDRILMWGDSSNPWQMYISDLQAPNYFPVTDTIPFDIGKREPITTVLEWRGNAVVFTTTSIQILTGTTPQDYTRNILHSGIGCVTERGAAVTGSLITFLSAEGVHSLKPNPYMIQVMDLQRADYPIKSELVKDVNARAMVYDTQFWLNIPSQNFVYRYYYEQGGVWVKDFSSKLHFVDMIQYGNTVYNLSSDGNIYVLDRTVYSDAGEAYAMDVGSKYYDLGASFNWKKVKRIFFIARQFTTNVNLKIIITVDSTIALQPSIGQAQIQTNADGSTSAIWNTAVGNTPPTTPDPTTGWFQFLSGTVLGSWVMGLQQLGNPQLTVVYTHIRGKGRRVKVEFIHQDPVPCEVFGFGVEYKEKKPY